MAMEYNLEFRPYCDQGVPDGFNYDIEYKPIIDFF